MTVQPRNSTIPCKTLYLFCTPMLPFLMFRLRQSRPHPQLPSASIQSLPVPASCARYLPRSARDSSTLDLASLLPPVTRHASPITNSFRIRTYEKHVRKPSGMNTSKTQHLNSFRMNTYEKTGGGRVQGAAPHGQEPSPNPAAIGARGACAPFLNVANAQRTEKVQRVELPVCRVK